MTRIYTNVPAMVARSQLGRNMASLQTSLNRLSTGFKINSGKDDPAGLIASELLRSDMTGIKTAIKNTTRANQMIATADSALNEVTNLLNTIRGLVTEAANTGAMSAEMIAANQLQVDASLDAIDRISAQTTFMGKKLLDGSLDFDMVGQNRNDLKNLSVQQVTFGSDHAPVDVDIQVRNAAEKAALYYNNPALAESLVLSWGGNYGFTTETFSKGATVAEIAARVNATSDTTGVMAEVGSDATKGLLYVSSLGNDNDIIIQAGLAGLNNGNVEIKYVKGTSEGVRVEYEEPVSASSPAKITVYLQTEAYKSATADDIDNTIVGSSYPTTAAGTNVVHKDATGNLYYENSVPVHDNNALKFIANIAGAQYNQSDIHFVDGMLTDPSWDTANPTGSAGFPYAKYSDTGAQSVALFGDVNGINNLTNLNAGEYFSIQSKSIGPEYNNMEVVFIDDTSPSGSIIPSGKNAAAVYQVVEDVYGNVISKTLQIHYKPGATVQEIQDALKLERHVAADGSTVVGAFELKASDAGVLTKTIDAADDRARSNTSNSGGDKGTLFVYLPPQGTAAGADYGLIKNPAYNASTTAYIASDSTTHEYIDANTIKNMFDLKNNASRGNERAAGLFTVERTADNDGTGKIHLNDYKIDANGAPDSTGTEMRYVRSAFENVFTGGVTGGNAITTAAEIVTVLNNSAFWGMTMCPELISELSIENAGGKFYDITNPPVITAALAPGQNGYFAVRAFEEVAYYGDPNDGTALQFLGEKDSPNIRFVAEPGNKQIWIDTTTVPDIIAQAQAVLTAQDNGASLTITAVKKGSDYDDVQFVFKQVSNDDTATLAPDRKDGWVEYDPGVSFAEAQIHFTTAAAGIAVPNTAFFLTANERGDMFNNVSVTMRLDDTMLDNEDGIQDGIIVQFDTKTNQVRITLDSSKVNTITANDVIRAVNNAKIGFSAQLSYSEETTNDGSGTFDAIGLSKGTAKTVGNTGTTGGHTGGTVTVYLTSEDPSQDTYSPPRQAPTQDDIVRLINADQVVGKMFVAKAYNSVQAPGDSREINFIKDGPIVSAGGLIEKGTLTVHLVTDENGFVQTTAKELAEWWDKQDPSYVANISVSIVRPVGAEWDECNDPYGNGKLKPTTSLGDCDQLIVNDIRFVGWNDSVEQQYYLANAAHGTMTSQRGINSSYEVIAKQLGPEWNGYTIQYIEDDSLTGHYADNLIAGSDTNPCDSDVYTGLERDDCGNLITPNSGTEKGMRLDVNTAEKKITVYVHFGSTTANDIEQLIESDVRTRNLFSINQLGDGTGLIDSEDDTLLTKDGSLPPGELNGAKLLFGTDASAYKLILKSTEYGSGQFVSVIATATDGGNSTFQVLDSTGKVSEKTYGKDVDALVNGIAAVGTGLNVNLNTSTLSLSTDLSERAGTTVGWSTGFTITGGGATYQIGPGVVSRQQITVGIQSVDTVHLGGVTGKLYQLRSGQDASLTNDTNKAYRIIEESLSNITAIRGRLGTIQKATFETNINVLQDTLSAITEAESEIRDTDFAEETANLTRAQILVQANMNTLGIANQIPNYMLSLLGS